MKNFSLIEPIKKEVHSSWNALLDNEKPAIKHIENQLEPIAHKINPIPENILRFLKIPLENIKIIILGQDPYPQIGAATGRAFEVGTLESWQKPFRNVSLKNILRSIYFSYTGEYISYTELKKRIHNGFSILGPQKIFAYWEKQGILLLNTSFSCEQGKPGSHEKIWSAFSRKLLNFINTQNPEIIWFLWGRHAQNVVSALELKNTYQSNHPMMCSPKRENDFLFNAVNPFYETRELIDWAGKKFF